MCCTIIYRPIDPQFFKRIKDLFVRQEFVRLFFMLEFILNLMTMGRPGQFYNFRKIRLTICCPVFVLQEMFWEMIMLSHCAGTSGYAQELTC